MRGATIAASPPVATTFGVPFPGHSAMIRMAEHELDATVELNYLPEGIRWRMSAPAGAVLDRGSQPAIGSQSA